MAAGAVAQGGQQEHHQHDERNDDADQCPQSAPPGDRDDHDREHRGQRDQRPRPLVVEEGVGRRSGRVDLAADPDVVTDCEVGLAGAAAELQQRVGALVGAGVDRDQVLHAMGTVVLGRHRIGGQHRARPSGLPQVAAVLDSTCPASVVTAPPAAFWNGSGMSTFCWLGHSHTAPASTATPMHDQCSDDDLGGHRAQRRGAGGVRVGVRMRHPQQGRGLFWPATGGAMGRGRRES